MASVMGLSGASVVRWQLVAQAGEPARATVWRLLAQLTDFTNERINLLLLLKNGLVELLHQVFGEAGLDLKVHQAFVCVGVWHLVFCYLSLASSVRRFSSSAL
jgi:hypothetical protein